MKALALALVLCWSTPAYAQKFAMFGDVGDSVNATKVAELTRQQNVAFIVMLGDQCYGFTSLPIQINRNYSAEYKAGKLLATLGNHEFNDPCGGGGAARYFEYFRLPGNERNWSIVKGSVELFTVNSNLTSGPTSTQGQWLKDALARSTAPWQIVFFHHPPFSSGSHGDSRWMQWPFELWGADAVVTGHDHDYERLDKGIPYIVSGLGGESNRPFRTVKPDSVKRFTSGFGALFVTAAPTSLKFEFRKTGGSLVDSLTLTKAATADPFAFKVSGGSQ